MAHSDRIFQRVALFTQSFEIDGDTEWGSNLILAAITATQCTAIVVEDVDPRLQCFLNLAADAHLVLVFLEQWKDADLDRGHTRNKSQHRTDVLFALFVDECFLVEGFANERKDGAITASGWLDDVRKEFLLGLLVEVNE